MTEKANKKFYQKWWFWVIVAVVLLGAIANCGEGNSTTADAVTIVASTEVKTPENETTSQTDVTQNTNGNYLESLPVYTADVWNGSKTEKIGTYAYVIASKEIAKTMTEDEFYSFAKNIVDDSGYNWFTIDFQDGTGIQFAGSIMSFATYGEIDIDRCVTTSIGYITVSEESVTYEEE